MTTLADLQARTQTMLGDSGETRFSDDLLEEALRQALDMLSHASPQVSRQVFTFTAGGRDQSLAECEGFIALLDFIYPYDAGIPDGQVCRAPHYIFWDGGVHCLHIGGGRIPVVGEKLLVNYAAAHTLQGLDGAETTSIRPGHESLLVIGAAGMAAISRSAQISEAHGSPASDEQALHEWGSQRMAVFNQSLERLRRSDAARPSIGYPGSQPHWRLDGWDRRSTQGG